jgi:hypothetical protein
VTSTPVFYQSVQRNVLAPVLIAFLVMGLAIAFVIRITPVRTADLTILHTAVFPTHTVFPSTSTLVNRDQSQDDLYVLTTLRVDDHLHLPLFLKDFTATLTTANGEDITTSATEVKDIATVLMAFPAIKSLASEPLLRETMIVPGQSAEGMILLHFPVTRAVWDTRRAAALNVELYHQGQQSILIERASETSSTRLRPQAKPISQ